MSETGSERRHVCVTVFSNMPQPASRFLPLLFTISALAALLQGACEPIADLSPIAGSIGYSERKGTNEVRRYEVVGEIGVGD